MIFICEWRNRRGFSQEKLAEIVGVHLNTLNRWERGHREPRVQEVIKLCSALGCTEAELFNGPAEEAWVLEIKIGEDKEEVMDMSETMGHVASVTCTRSGASVLLAGKWETFRDDEKFEDFVNQLRATRGIVLRNGAELEGMRGE